MFNYFFIKHLLSFHSVLGARGAMVRDKMQSLLSEQLERNTNAHPNTIEMRHLAQGVRTACGRRALEMRLARERRFTSEAHAGFALRMHNIPSGFLRRLHTKMALVWTYSVR